MDALDVASRFQRLEAAIEYGLVKVGAVADSADPNTGPSCRMDDIVDQTLVGA